MIESAPVSMLGSAVFGALAGTRSSNRGRSASNAMLARWPQPSSKLTRCGSPTQAPRRLSAAPTLCDVDWQSSDCVVF